MNNKKLLIILMVYARVLQAQDPLPPGSYQDPTPYGEFCQNCEYNAEKNSLCCWCPFDSYDPVFVHTCKQGCASYKKGKNGLLACEEPKNR